MLSSRTRKVGSLCQSTEKKRLFQNTRDNVFGNCGSKTLTKFTDEIPNPPLTTL